MVLSMVLVWTWGSRFALSLGHRGGPVFVVTVVASFAFAWGTYIAAMVVRWLERILVGWGNPVVFQLARPDHKFHSPEFFDTFLVSLGLYATPIMAAAACVFACGMRWRLPGALLAAAGAAVLLYLPFTAAPLLQGLGLESGASPFLMFYTAAVLILLGVSWMAFRKQPA